MSAPTLRPYGDRALLAELAGEREVLGWLEAVRERDVAGVADLVPAARTVLVVAEDGVDVASLRTALDGLEPLPAAATAPPTGPVVEVPVRYDGPDLAEVARLTGLREADVVATHTSATWRVAFGGFAPGFAYLVGDVARLQVPRRDSARASVPAGAVGLAGEYTGVYPRPSPGGWQLIGSTDLPVWDADRDPPALLSPGVVVRFVAEPAP